MPSIFSSKKDKRALKTGAHSLPLTRTASGAKEGVKSSRPESGGFKRINGYRQEVGEFGTRNSGSHITTTKQALPLTPPESPTQAGSPPVLPPKYTFAPTRVPSETPSSNSIDSFAYSSDDVTGLRPYGVLGGIGSRITLGLEDVGKVVRDVGAELDRRGLTTPLLFSNQALELNQTRVKMLINTYINTIGGRSLQRPGSRTPNSRQEGFAQDLRFAKEHELAWLLRWALSRIARQREGIREVCHGMMEWETYEEWRGRERAANYPLDAFPYLSALIPADLYHQVLTPLFQLLSRFAAHSHLSGLTPHALSSLFAPLLFDISASLPAMAAHAIFVRAASATEHMLLAFIRSQSWSKPEVGINDLPTRLREWVVGYPSMLATDADLARGSPRRGARVVRCERASRNVRAYTRDLVIGAELWAADLTSGQTWETWDRVIWKQRRAEVSRPKFAPAWKRRMAVKDTLPLPASAADQTGLNRHTTYGKAKAPGKKDDKRERQPKKSDEEEARYGSLAGKEWSMFEEGGFDTPSELGQMDIKSRLQFDLTESAKTSVSARRQTMDWTEFASAGGGFSRTDPHLAVSLTFSEPLANSITSWPSDRDALQRKLHKSQKEAIPFHHDTSVRLGALVEADQGESKDEKGRVWVEEAFLDCWGDLMMGAGWAERDELTFKESNWALIEYRAKPSRSDSQQQCDPLADPRTSDVCILFEERVPLEYQMAIANPQEKKTFAKMFSSRSRRKAHESAPMPASLARRIGDDHDFDKMLMQRSTTKRVTLGTGKEGNTVWHREPPLSPMKQPSSGQTTPTQHTAVRKRTKSAIQNGKPGSGEDPKVNDGKASFFSKNRVARRVKTNEDNRSRARREREQEVDFELHSASGISSGANSPSERDGMVKPNTKKEDEKWMDILIANGARRMDRQDAIVPQKLLSPKSAGLPPASSPMASATLPASAPAKHTTMADKQPPAEHHTPELTQDRSADDEAQSIEPATPRASGFSEPSHRSYESPEVDPYAHGSSHRPDGHGGYSHTYNYSDEEPNTDMRSSDEFTTRTSAEMTNERISFSNDRRHEREPLPQTNEIQPNPQQREVPLVSPIPVRDTIHGIVSHYGRESLVSYDSEYDESQGTISMSPSSGRQARRSNDEERDGLEELHSPVLPPAPVFDLTPGREPSPMRYRHGEPLQFVREADETASAH